jgi:hypothetical protein
MPLFFIAGNRVAAIHNSITSDQQTSAAAGASISPCIVFPPFDESRAPDC